MQTVIKYQDTALPTDGVSVTLFNSLTAFPPGGSFHLLGQQWFQYTLAVASAAGTSVGDVIGEFSNAGRNTVEADWVQFYSRPTIDAADSGAPAINADEVYVGMYKDVRFRYLIDGATADLTVFEPNLALNDCKPTSKVTDGDLLVDNP